MMSLHPRNSRQSYSRTSQPVQSQTPQNVHAYNTLRYLELLEKTLDRLKPSGTSHQAGGNADRGMLNSGLPFPR